MNAPFSSWPPPLEEVDYHHGKLPKLLKLLMNLLLWKSFPVAERVEKLSSLLGQDIIYNISNGKIKATKHVQLGITTKRETGSRLMLDSLNCLDHSISYDQVTNIETSFAELNVKNRSNRSFVTNNVQPSALVSFVYNNCDHNPETFPGASFHVTNGNIIPLSSKTDEPEQSVSTYCYTWISFEEEILQTNHERRCILHCT